MTKQTKRRLIVALALVAVLALFLIKGWITGGDILTALTGEDASQSQGVSLSTGELPQESSQESSQQPQGGIDEHGRYTSKDDVALYLHTYGRLPENFITKSEAEALGWVSSKGNLWEVTDEMSIGGDKFGNREGLLPKAKGRQWYECDIDYAGGYRGAQRILYSSDGLIYYTDDHYESYTQLY